MVKERKETFTDYVGKFTNKPFVKGGHGQKGCNGYDCMGLIYAFVIGRGKYMVDNFKGLTLDNYQDFFYAHTNEAYDILLDFFKTLGKEINPKMVIAGDLLIIKSDVDYYPAICAGNGNIMASYYDSGVRVVSIKNGDIVMARRI